MSYVKNILISIDQFGNALAGGNPDCTISGRTGYFQYNAIKPFIYYWKALAFIIDLTFYPWDGHGHCKQAFAKEIKNEFYATDSVIFLGVLSLVTLVSCSIMIVPFWIIFGIKTLIKKICKK